MKDICGSEGQEQRKLSLEKGQRITSPELEGVGWR